MCRVFKQNEVAGLWQLKRAKARAPVDLKGRPF